jgi:hypothetical protein
LPRVYLPHESISSRVSFAPTCFGYRKVAIHRELHYLRNICSVSVYFTPTNAHVKPLFCSFYCKMYPYTYFDPRIIVRVFFSKKASITSTTYFEGSNSTRVLIFVLKYLNFKIHKTLKLTIYKLKS